MKKTDSNKKDETTLTVWGVIIFFVLLMIVNVMLYDYFITKIN
jgi:hypothetical protein